jgi:hypothetical protein
LKHHIIDYSSAIRFSHVQELIVSFCHFALKVIPQGQIHEVNLETNLWKCHGNMAATTTLFLDCEFRPLRDFNLQIEQRQSEE